jgi:hypothetical protein
MKNKKKLELAAFALYRIGHPNSDFEWHVQEYANRILRQIRVDPYTPKDEVPNHIPLAWERRYLS